MSNTYQGLIDKTLRLLTPTAVGMGINITTTYVINSATLVLDAASPVLPAVRPGVVLSCGLQVWYVLSVSGNTATVVPNYQGSTSIGVTANTGLASLVYVKPRFTQFDVAIAINDELDALSSPENGLGQILSTDVTYVPSFMGYALPSTFDNASSKVLEISYKVPDPSRRFPLIRRDDYRVVRNQTDAAFPSGCGFITYKVAQAGLPMHVQYLAPFSHLAALTDDALTVGGVPVTAQDIIPMGVALRLAPDREIQRNSMSAQPDPRKGTEVPAGAIMGSARVLEQRYLTRISQEQERLVLSFPNARR